jgi:hypothetical protein
VPGSVGGSLEARRGRSPQVCPRPVRAGLGPVTAGLQRLRGRSAGRGARAISPAVSHRLIRCVRSGVADCSAETELVAGIVPLPRRQQYARRRPTHVRGLTCRAPVTAGHEGAQLIRAVASGPAHAGGRFWPSSRRTLAHPLAGVCRPGRGSRTPGTGSRPACRRPRWCRCDAQPPVSSRSGGTPGNQDPEGDASTMRFGAIAWWRLPPAVR